MNRFFLLLSCSAVFILMPLASFAADGQAQELEVSRPSDLEMSCGALSREASLMRDIISVTDDIQEDKEMNNYGISAAAGVGSFLIGSATGGIGFAAAGFLAKELNNNDSEKAESVQDIAEQRRTFMVGIYNAKGCIGPIEHAMQDIDLTFAESDDYAGIEPAAGEIRHADAGMHYNN